MNPRTCPLFLFLLTLVLLLHKSLSTINPHYMDCQPFPCGSLDISYPFYVADKQPPLCGYPGFNVLCTLETATIQISGDEYVINSINYTDLSINITNQAFSSPVFGCLSSVHNLTLDGDSKFNFTSNPKDLFLLQQCTSNNITRHTEIRSACKADNDQKILGMYGEDFHKEEVGKCNETVQVPYEEEQADDESGIQELLRKGITLKYSSNNCSACNSSGGRCGFNQTTSLFFCACPDRDHSGRCHPTKSVHVKGKTWGIILGTVSGLAIIAVVVVSWIRRKKKSDSSTLQSRSLSFSRLRTDLEVGTMNGVTVYSYTELEEATNSFDPDKQLGEGGFGVVYYGKLRDGREVAVKRLYEKSYKRIEQFKNEIRILTDLRHQNLVTLYGCTSRHTRELLLVYEYIPNGTVADHLHGEKADSRLLPWSTRMSIAIETATALSYLHYKDIIHRDVKTNNILLDNNFSVKVADFGLSRLFPADVTHVSTAPQGTPGYVDPEYHQCYHLTNKSDVYSFGVVLVELISSLLAVDVGRERYEINLSNYAMNRIQSSAISELVDPNLGFETDFKVRRMTTLVAELASQCLQHDREVRPSMEEVLETLKNIASEDYDALEAEETNWSARTMQIPKPPPSPTDKDDIELLRNTRKPPPSPVSVMDNWLSSSKSTTPNTSKST